MEKRVQKAGNVVANTTQGFVVIGAQNVFFSITNLRTLVEVERGKYPIGLGEDVFADQIISPETVETIIGALRAINQVFQDYAIETVHVVGSHSLFEAPNAEYVRDQLFNRTGWPITHLSIPQEALYRNEAVMARFPKFDEVTKQGTMLIDISSGSVELTAFANGEFGFSRNFNLGPLRVYEVMRDVQRDVPNFVEVLRDFIDSRLLDFMRLLPPNVTYQNMILMGSSLSVFETLIPAGQSSVVTTRERFDELYAQVVNANDQYLIDHYDLPTSVVAQVLPTVLLLNQLVKMLNSQTIWVSNLKLLDGLEINQAIEAGFKPVKFDPNAEIITSAVNLANRYQVDPVHRDTTVKFALQLFDRLKKLHVLSKRDRLLLQVAATVNDIGSYIDTHRHYAHSDYIIMASDIIGLTQLEQQIVAAIAHFHSSDTPHNDLLDFPVAETQTRLRIAKLSALLRVADSLDASRQQKIQQLSVSLKTNKVVLTVHANDDVELERWTLARKSAFFTEVFGLPVELKGGR